MGGDDLSGRQRRQPDRIELSRAAPWPQRFFLICLTLFTLSSVLCGFAPNLNSLLLFRIMQGLGGGGMVPVSQSILAGAFPPEKRGQGFALFGIAVVVAPVVGPTLGGWIADNFSWQWCFLINGPVGVVALGLIGALLRESKDALADRKRFLQQGRAFDLVGFVLVATFLGALEIALDRGLEDDWFSSRFIVIASGICALAFVAMIPWELSRRNPIIDVRMVATRQFGASFLVMLGAGAILLATTQYLPQLVQQNFGYTATWAGLVLTPGGIVTVFMMPLVGQLTGRVQPRLIAAGAAICAYAMYDMTKVNGDLGFWFFATSRIYIGIGLPLVFLPIIAASYDGVCAGQDRHGLGPDQCRAQYRRLDRHFARQQRARAPRAVSSEQAGRTRQPVDEPISKHVEAVDGLFHRARQFARASPAAGLRMDRPASSNAGELPRICRRVLDPDADLARRRAARAHAAQRQARWSRRHGALIG